MFIYINILFPQSRTKILITILHKYKYKQVCWLSQTCLDSFMSLSEANPKPLLHLEWFFFWDNSRLLVKPSAIVTNLKDWCGPRSASDCIGSFRQHLRCSWCIYARGTCYFFRSTYQVLVWVARANAFLQLKYTVLCGRRYTPPSLVLLGIIFDRFFAFYFLSF